MEYGIFLDDIRLWGELEFSYYPEGKALYDSWLERAKAREVRFHLCRNASQFKHTIEDRHGGRCPTFITFDHDIASMENGQEITGYDLAKWLVEKDLDAGGKFIPENFHFAVHSANSVGAENIYLYLSGYLKFKKETKNG